MSIRQKIFRSFTTVLVITSIAAYVGILLVFTTGNNYTNCLNYFGTTQGLSGRMGLALSGSYNSLMGYVNSPDEKQQSEFEQEIAKLESICAELSIPIQNIKITPGGTSERLQIIPNIQNNFQALNSQIQKYITFSKSLITLMASDETNAKKIDELDSIYTQNMQMIDQFVLELNDAATAEKNLLSSGIVFFISIIVFVIFLAALVSLIITRRLSRQISIPAKQMEIAANELAAGNLKVEIISLSSKNSKDEIASLSQALAETIASLKSYIDEIRRVLGEMANGNFDVSTQVDFKGDFSEIESSMTQIIHSMRDTFTHIRKASDQVTEDSKQLSNGSGTMSRGAEEQASSIQTLYETITDISTQIQQTACKAEEARKIAQQTGEEMDNSNQQMASMTASMELIHRTSDQISRIMNTINDIAMQTNILALNAAIEASRAGAAGKGFSVVAGEIRNLAVKSSQAAKDTAGLIEDSINSVKDGYLKAEETALVLSSAAELAQSSVQLINEIAEATTLQSELITQFSVGIEQISSVVQDNSQAAIVSSSVSQQLFQQSSVLNQLLARFQL